MSYMIGVLFAMGFFMAIEDDPQKSDNWKSTLVFVLSSFVWPLSLGVMFGIYISEIRSDVRKLTVDREVR